MKKFIVCLFVISIVAFPLSATAWEQLDYTVDIKAYGNQYADYSTGVIDVFQATTSNTSGTSVEWTSFNNVAGDPYVCDGPGCGMSISQGDFTVTDFNTHTYATLEGTNLVGSVDMTSLGGLAACVSYPSGVTLPSYSGSFNQTQTVANSSNGYIDGIYNSTSYVGTQTLDLQISKP